MTLQNNKPDPIDRLENRSADGPTGQVIEMDWFRQVRRWDEPQNPDPYPERHATDQGVRQGNASPHNDDRKSKNGPSSTERFVDPDTAEPGQMTTTRTKSVGRHPFAAATPEPIARKAPRPGWWAVGLSVVAQLTVTAAIEWGDADPAVAAIVSIAILACSALLIVAEQITGRSGE